MNGTLHSRWAEYYWAEHRAMLAIAEAFKVSPFYDNDEAKRAEHVADYERLARNYAAMAKKEEA